ncbi:MAG: tRNA (adenosine(37)-N6)-threonylcarbamoyltransferase complex ATPase subunit type 1 TsaE [Clostridiales bacterium]|nr:tRNA (adenosine(37)-N6)-threonylcarbamoyltransferase complex ATPase subunit type 1 TsaE [Clostridiales bacterium]
MELLSHSEADTQEIGFKLSKKLKAGDIVTLFGGLGAGKTAFTRGIARGLGIAARVTSPTFTIVNEYAGTPPLFHFDLYRLSGFDELDAMGFSEYLDRGGISVIEWSEILGGAVSNGAVVVTLEIVDEKTRKITIEGAVC